MALSEEEQKIETWFKEEYRKLQDRYGKYGVPLDESFQLSDEYKARHNVLIDRRKAEESLKARIDAFTETHSLRLCRDCDTELEPHVGRGRPPVRCPGCREKRELAKQS